jgi:hypothetical protein
MRTDTEKTAATLKCTHVAVSGFTIDAPNQSRVVRIVVPMHRYRRTERDEVVSVCVRLRTRVLNIQIQLEKKIVFLLLDCSNENFFRIVIPSGVVRSHRMLLSESRANVNSGSAGLCGIINHRSDWHVLGEFKITRLASSRCD